MERGRALYRRISSECQRRVTPRWHLATNMMSARHRRRLPPFARSLARHTNLNFDVASLGRLHTDHPEQRLCMAAKPLFFKGNPSRSTGLACPSHPTTCTTQRRTVSQIVVLDLRDSAHVSAPTAAQVGSARSPATAGQDPGTMASATQKSPGQGLVSSKTVYGSSPTSTARSPSAQGL